VTTPVLLTLHRLAFAAFCGGAPWRCSSETNEALHALLPSARDLPPDVAAEIELLCFVVGHYEPDEYLEPEDWDEIELEFPRGGATREQCLPYAKRKIFAAYARRHVLSARAQ
jgi:hypothetical protein